MANDFAAVALCAGGIYASYLVYGLVQESVYRTEGFTFTITFLAIQCLSNMVGAMVGAKITGMRQPPNVPGTAFVLPAFTFIGAMFCSNQALRYVSYPVQALAKSCKMVPVMAFQVLVFGKSYVLREYIMVALVTLGIILFQLKDNGGENSAYGLTLLLASLALDGLTGPKQEHVRRTHNASAHQIMFYCNFWAFLMLAAGLVASGEHLAGVAFIARSAALTRKVAAFACLSAVGQNFIFITLHRFNALVLTTVTTTRKFFTVLASVVYFGHTLKPQQYHGIALVSAGLLLELYGKYSKASVGDTKKSA